MGPEKVAAHHATSANTTRTTPKLLMTHVLLAQTDNLGGRATSRICATALIPTTRLKLLLPRKLQLKPHKLLPLLKLLLLKLQQQQRRLKLPQNTQRRIAHRQPKRQRQRSQPQRLLLRIPHQLVESATLVVKNAKLSLAITRQRSILTACLVEEIPCSHGGHAILTSFASANDAEMSLCKHCCKMKQCI